MRPSMSRTHSGTARRFRVSLGLCTCYINEYKLIFSDENDISFTHKIHSDVQKTKIVLFHRTLTYRHYNAGSRLCWYCVQRNSVRVSLKPISKSDPQDASFRGEFPYTYLTTDTPLLGVSGSVAFVQYL